MIRRYKTEIWLFSLGFGIRLAYAIAVQFFFGSHGFAANSDAESFIAVANNLLAHGVFSPMTESPFIPDPLRTPPYPFFLALFLYFKTPLFWIAAFQNFLAGITGVLIYRTGKIIFKSAAVGVIAAALFILEPVSIYWNNLLMSDNLFSFLFFLAFYLFVVRKFYLSALILGLAALTRPIGFYFAPLFLAASAVLYYRGDYKGDSFTWKKALIAVLLFFMVLAPWAARNKILFNTWELSSVGWVNLYFFTFSRFAATEGIDLPTPEAPEGYSGDAATIFTYDFANVPFYKSTAQKLILERPWEYLKFHLAYFLKTFNYHGYDYLIEQVVRTKFPNIGEKLSSFAVRAGQGAWWLIYALGLIGLFRKEHRAWSIFILSFAALNNFLLIASGVSQGGRYGLPVMPMLLLLGSYGAVSVYRAIQNFYLERRIIKV